MEIMIVILVNIACAFLASWICRRNGLKSILWIILSLVFGMYCLIVLGIVVLVKWLLVKPSKPNMVAANSVQENEMTASINQTPQKSLTHKRHSCLGIGCSVFFICIGVSLLLVAGGIFISLMGLSNIEKAIAALFNPHTWIVFVSEIIAKISNLFSK
jgi:hypothetical protein